MWPLLSGAQDVFTIEPLPHVPGVRVTPTCNSLDETGRCSNTELCSLTASPLRSENGAFEDRGLRYQSSHSLDDANCEIALEQTAPADAPYSETDLAAGARAHFFSLRPRSPLALNAAWLSPARGSRRHAEAKDRLPGSPDPAEYEAAAGERCCDAGTRPAANDVPGRPTARRRSVLDVEALQISGSMSEDPPQSSRAAQYLRFDDPALRPLNGAARWLASLVLLLGAGVVLSLCFPLVALLPIAGYPGSTAAQHVLANALLALSMSQMSLVLSLFSPELANVEWTLYCTGNCFLVQALGRSVAEQLSGARQDYIVLYFFLNTVLIPVSLPFVQVLWRVVRVGACVVLGPGPASAAMVLRR